MSANVMETIVKIGLLPTIDLKDPTAAVQAAQALGAGGVPSVVVQWQDKDSASVVAALKEASSELLVGVRSVSSSVQAADAIAAGADVIFSSSFDAYVPSLCASKDVAFIPSVASKDELDSALSLGLTVVEIANADAGQETLESGVAKSADLRFVASGEMTPETLKKYAENSSVVAVAGNFPSVKAAVDASDWAALENVARQMVEISLGYAIGHVGINCNSIEEANATADFFGSRFGGLKKREIDISFFAGKAVEAMKKPSFGANGHIGIATNSIARSIYQLERNGMKIRFTKKNPQGAILAAYIEDEIGGFAVHICNK